MYMCVYIYIYVYKLHTPEGPQNKNHRESMHLRHYRTTWKEESGVNPLREVQLHNRNTVAASKHIKKFG